MELGVLSVVAAHRTAALDAVMLVLTAVGRAGAVWLVLAAVRAVVNRRAAMGAWQTVLAVLIASAVSDGVVKPLVDRPRPYVADTALAVVGSRPATASFPSGHAATAAAGAFLLASSWPAARLALWGLALAISLSRIYLGVHYPSDVVAGLLLGVAVGWFVRGRTVWRDSPARSRL
jgi:undecaprenyl-diphosphatase